MYKEINKIVETRTAEHSTSDIEAIVRRTVKNEMGEIKELLKSAISR